MRRLIAQAALSERLRLLDDVHDLLRQAEIDVAFLRARLGSDLRLQVLATPFESLLARTGHPAARRDYDAS